MHVLAGGDSFSALTDHEGAPNTAWPFYLEGHEVTRCAEMAAGNSLITRNVVNDIHRVSPDAVVIGWSDPNRFELFFHKDDDPFLYESLFKKYTPDTDEYNKGTPTKVPESFTNYVMINDEPTGNRRLPGENSSWLKSGGGYGVWEFGNDHIDWKMRLFLKNFHNEELQYLKTIENILSVQWLCEIKEIPLFNFKAWDHSLFNKDYENSKLLESQVNPFTWYSSTLFDFTKEKGFNPGEAPVHPPKKYQKLFAQEVIIPWLDKL